ATFADATAVAVTADASLTDAQMLTNRLFARADGVAGDITLTSRTAAQLIAAGSGTAGDTFEIIIVNNDVTSGDDVILAVATGVTNGGVTSQLTVANGTSATFTFVVTSSTAITVYRTATA
ncbi:MAG: hypothetical protein ACKOQU_10030, partial [Acidimicrobiaceae bacterium]